MRVRDTPALKHFEMPKHYFNPNTISTQTLCQPEHFFNLKIFGLRAKFEKFERTLEFSDSEQNLKNLSGPSHRIAKFEKFERTLEFSDSEQNLKNLSGPSHRSAKFEKFERTLA
jgi:hypothetical protein